jgi:hypothetical protein
MLRPSTVFAIVFFCSLPGDLLGQDPWVMLDDGSFVLLKDWNT